MIRRLANAAALMVALLVALAITLVPASPAYVACGDSPTAWVPYAATSQWYVEILLNDNTDLTAATVLTYAGQLAATEITETTRIL